MSESGANRRSRPGSPRRSGPGRREDPREFVEDDLSWSLWTYRTIFPDASPEDLREVLRRMRKHLAREREAFAGLWAGDRSNLSPGHGFLERNPGLARGIVCSMHLGPYAFLAEPFFKVGIRPGVLLNRRAMVSYREATDRMAVHLGYRTGPEWIPVDDGPFLRRALKVLREDRPLVVYLDGNTGAEGMAGTRARGLRYRLPGRDIRVRTGLARLAIRTGTPVHRVVLAWDDDGSVLWEGDRTLRWERTDDPAEATRTLFDWCFSQVMRRPDQWQYWAMLKESSACFHPATLDHQGVPTGLREDFKKAYETCLERSADTVRLILERAVAVWPGGVLADLSGDRFYPASGLRDADLEPLRAGRPTLRELAEHHGESWVRFHGLRLCLLGLARLGA